ncbi:MAG: tetratricopeptide repeat protein [Planctomycetia bacterium]
MPTRVTTLPARLALLVLVLACVPCRGLAPAVAGEDGADEERTERIALQVERGTKAFQSGNHDEVRARMKRLAELDPAHPLPALLLARVAERTGAYEEGLALVVPAHEARREDRSLAALRLDLLLELGRLDEAESLARSLLASTPTHLVARTVLGRVLEERGRRKEALEAYDAVVAAYAKVDVQAAELPFVAAAAIRATWLSPNPGDDMLPDALRLLGERVKAEPGDLDLLLQYASVWLEDRGKNGQSTARKYFTQALKENEELADARVGLARVALVFYQQDQALQQLDRALQSNARHVPALALLASVHVGNGDYEKAEALLARALAVNPSSKEARAVRVALLTITGKAAEAAELAARVLADDPSYGRLWLVVSDLVGERQRRYDRAADWARKALEVDPQDALGYVTLGEALMNLGQTDEARKAFQEAVSRSKRYSDVKRDNWLESLDAMERFTRVETPRLRVRMAPSEAKVFEPYLVPLLEEAWDTLTRKYGLELTPVVHVDAFHRMDDFSVRSVGVPGLPALGVCFGKVITLLGPTSRPLGSFSWSRTAWHEFAHVVTLGVSEGQVPRWLTEGLSVYEEQARRPRWGRDMDRELYDRWRNGRLLRMDRINAAFRGPDILFAYYQGGLIAEHLAETRGFQVIPEMLRMFARDKTTAEVFREVLKTDLKDYDAEFEAFVARRVGAWRMVPRWDDASLAAWRERVKQAPQDALAWARLGHAHAQRGVEVDAAAALGKARALAPAEPEVLLLEALLARRGKRLDIAQAAFERLLAGGGDDLEARLFLAARALEKPETAAQAVAHLEAAKRCFPRYLAKDSPYLQLASLYRAEQRLAQSIAELEAFAAIAAEDMTVRRELLAWYKQQGDHAGVARVCEEMVDVSPFGADRGEPPDLGLHRSYAEALEALGRRAEALRERRVQVWLLESLPEAARREAGEVQDRLLLGQALLAEGRREEAREQAAAILRLEPGHVGARVLQQEAADAAGR